MHYEESYGYRSNRNPMASAAITLGILSIFTSAIIYIALPVGALAVLFAILSKRERRMPGKGKAGIICGLIGMIATVVITVSSFYFVFGTETGRTYFEQYIRMYTGEQNFELEEFLDDLLASYGLSSAEDNESSANDTADIPQQQITPDHSDDSAQESPAADPTQQEGGMYL